MQQQALSLMTQCVIVRNHLILKGKWLNMCHRTIQQTVPGHVLSVAEQHQTENTSGSMLGHKISIFMSTFVHLKIVIRGRMARNLEMMSSQQCGLTWK